MSRYWSDHVSGLVPYVAGEQPKISNLLKLNTNENPYGPSPKALQAIRDAVTDRLKLYPDNESTALRQAVARLHGIAPGQVFVGNGSDEVLAHLFNALFRHQGKSLWMPDITYSFYRTYCLLYDIPVNLVPLDENFAISVDDYLDAQSQGAAAIIFANPNAPTGLAMGLPDIARIAAANPDIPVVVDEAYVDFGAESATRLIEQHPNLVTVHTFSKSRSLAGLRVGFAMASADIVDGLNRVKDSFNSYPLDMLAQAGAVAAIDDEAWLRETCQAVIDARQTLTTQLQAMGFQVLPSLTNFVFVRHPGHDAAGIAAALRQQGVLVRHFDKPRIRQFLRITVGTPEECARLLDCLSGSLSAVPSPAA